MKAVGTFLLGLSMAVGMTVSAQNDTRVTQYINPFIGTGQVDANSLKGGNFPGATTPFGLVQLSPEEFVCPNGDGASGYDYALDTIYGFTHTHLSGTGCVDLLDVLIQPTSKPLTALLDTETFPEKFAHANEKASVGYYAVRYSGSDILTAVSYTHLTLPTILLV